MDFPAAHRTKLHSTNPLERVNGEVKRGTEVIGNCPNEEAVVHLVGAILLEQNDEWSVQRGRYMTLETIPPLSNDPIVSLPAGQSDRPGQAPPETVMEPRLLHHAREHDL
jgi:putative transposase